MTLKLSSYAGPFWKEDSYGVAITAAEAAGVLAVGLGDGRVCLRLLDKPERLIVPPLEVHQGGLAALLMAADEKSFISAGEDGKICRIFTGGKVETILKIDKAWFEHLTTQGSMLAAAYKKSVVLLTQDGTVKATFEDHPSAVAGLAFDPKGKRLAVSHYQGVSLYWVNGEATQKPQVLNWKGSHLGVAFSPNGKYLQTAMQENALHGWRLPDFSDFQMSGYALKPKSFNWTQNGKWLASSGAAGIICWDCSGKGPMGKPPLVLGEACADVVTRVACHPALDLVAAGTAGGLVYLARFQDEEIVYLATHGSTEITALNWSPSGRVLLATSEEGISYAWPFSE